MRILVVGDWHSALHEETVYQALQALGHEVFRFAWHRYFLSHSPQKMARAVESLIKKAQNKYLIGPLLRTINRDCLALVTDVKPDFVFFYRGTHIFPATLLKLKKLFPSVTLVGYNNDDPFSHGHTYRLWRHFIRCIPLYDIVLAYREHNLADFQRAGAKRTELLRSWYVPERNHPVSLSSTDHQQYDCDVVFIGHYEDDGRAEFLESILQNGWKLRLFGPGYEWDPIVRSMPHLSRTMPVKLVWGEDYNKALCGAKIALCFLSKLNRDTYTRRCFEIPASGTLLLSEYSQDLARLYKAGVEADFFRSKEELLHKIGYYLRDDPLRNTVSQAGNRRVAADGHDVVSRMCQLIAWVREIKNATPQ